MRYMLASWVVSTLAFLLASFLLPGFHVANLTAALVGAAVLGVLNALVRPVVILFTLPLTVLTLGLFLLVINGLMLYISAAVVHGIDITNFFSAIAAALVISVVNAILGKVLG